MIGRMGNQLKKLREQRGLTQEAAAEGMGISKSQYIKLERGDRRLTEQYIVAAAQTFGAAPADVISDNAPPVDYLGPAVSRTGTSPLFGGFVQAGGWLAVDEYFQQDEYEMPEFVIRHPAYPKLRQYAYQARGQSMDLAGISDGMWVVAADAADFIDSIGDIESGDLVVVERVRHQGAERELTVKEIRYYRDRYELVPRSSDPSYKPFIVPHDHSVSGDELEVKIVGVVLTAYRDFRRTRR